MKYDFKKIKLSGVLKILGIGFFIWGSLGGGAEIHAMEEEGAPRPRPYPVPAAYTPTPAPYYQGDAPAPRPYPVPAAYAPMPAPYYQGEDAPAPRPYPVPAAYAPMSTPYYQAHAGAPTHMSYSTHGAAAQAPLAPFLDERRFEDRQNNIHGALLRAGLAVKIGIRYMTPSFCADYFMDGADGQYMLRADPSVQIKYSPEARTWNLEDCTGFGLVKVSPMVDGRGISFHKQKYFRSTEMSRAIYAALKGAGLEGLGHNFGLDEFQCQEYFIESTHPGVYVLRNNPSIYVRYVQGLSRLENTEGSPISVSPNFETGGLSFLIG